MPASMRIAGIGFMVKVSGSSIEMAESAPMPGSTPMRLPISTPKNDHMRLCGCSATPKPYQRSCSAWCTGYLSSEEGNLHLEGPPEHHDRHRDDAGAEDRGALPGVHLVAHRGDEDDREGGGHEATVLTEDHEGYHGAADADPSAPFGR